MTKSIKNEAQVIAVYNAVRPFVRDFTDFKILWDAISAALSTQQGNEGTAMALHDSIDNCPFCGSEGVILEDSGYNGKGFVRCWTCFSAGPESDSKSQAVEAWNRRASPPSPNSAVTEALRRAERKLTAYVGVCNGDKELTDTVLPMVRAALDAAPTGGQP